jgi:hypothetical protein
MAMCLGGGAAQIGKSTCLYEFRHYSLLTLLSINAYRVTRGQGDWLGLTSYDSFIRDLSPAYADAP